MALRKIVIDSSERQEEERPAAKLRVAAYCRVSTASDQQLTSFDTQVRVYTDRIRANPDWEFVEVYADEGITGTSKKKRKEFLRMIEDCEAGKIDFILTKSISRFARNTLDCITEVRHLQSLGVQVYFEENNLDTSQAFSEMLLTILAAFAQEESRSLSENVKWGIRKRYEEGRDRWVRIYGYTRTEEGTYRIVEEEAAVIRRIFELYEKGMSMSKVGAKLKEEGILTPRGRTTWNGAMVASILENEKYVGDIQLQKMYTADHLTHRIVKNDCTEIPSYYIDNHHDAIISRKTFTRVTAIRAMNNRRGQTVQYPFGDMLICPHCGRALVQRKLFVQYISKGWNCERGRNACRNFLIRSNYVEEAMLAAYREVELDEVRRIAGNGRANVRGVWETLETVKDEEHEGEKKPEFGEEGEERKGEGSKAAEAMRMLVWKETHREFQKVDYYWLDELVDHITFGLGSDGESDHTMTVRWKCGTSTTVSTGITRPSNHPEHVAELHNAWLVRMAEKDGMSKEAGGIPNNTGEEQE